MLEVEKLREIVVNLTIGMTHRNHNGRPVVDKTIENNKLLEKSKRGDLRDKNKKDDRIIAVTKVKSTNENIPQNTAVPPSTTAVKNNNGKYGKKIKRKGDEGTLEETNHPLRQLLSRSSYTNNMVNKMKMHGRLRERESNGKDEKIKFQPARASDKEKKAEQASYKLE